MYILFLLSAFQYFMLVSALQRSNLAVTEGSISYQWLLKAFSSRARFLKLSSS